MVILSSILDIFEKSENLGPTTYIEHTNYVVHIKYA